ncbi:MAG: hypothetical protein R3Y56_10550 [Akkermansia sp.]
MPETPITNFAQKVAALDVDLARRQRAHHFFTARVEDVKVTQALQKVLLEVMQRGGSAEEFIRDAQEALKPFKLVESYFPTPEAKVAYHKNIRNLDGRERLRLIFKTNVTQAHAMARHQADFEPRNLKNFPCYKFVRIGGAKVKRPRHEKHENAVRFKWDFDYWADFQNAEEIGGFMVPWAPFGYNSYMDVRAVMINKAPAHQQALYKDMLKNWDERMGKILEEHDSRFGGSASERYEPTHGKASGKKMSPEERQKVIDSCAEEGIKVDDIGGQLSINWQLSGKVKPTPTLTPTPTPKPEPKPEPKPKKWDYKKTEKSKKSPVQTRVDRLAAVLKGRGIVGEFTWGESITLAQKLETLETVARLTKEYKVGFIGNIGSYKAAKNSVGAHAGLGTRGGLTLELNHNGATQGVYGLSDWRDYKTKEQIYRDKGWLLTAQEYADNPYTRHNVGATKDGIALSDLVTHEFGHVLHFSANKDAWVWNSKKDKLINIVDENIKKIKAKAKRRRKKQKPDIHSISEYANKNEYEFFAECFTAYKKGETLPQYIIDMIKEIIILAK